MCKKTINVQADGHNGKIFFNIDVTEDHIDNISITESSETPAVLNQAFTKLKNKIIEQQSFDVDVIAGASVMTGAILDAGKKALIKNNIILKPRKKIEVHKQETLKFDVAVIGSGMAGLMAACRSLSMGKKVIILEKNGYLGGASILNGSNVIGTGSKVSKEIFGKKANSDSVEKLKKDITRECNGTNYSNLTDVLTKNIGKAVDFITQFAKLTYQKAEIQTIEHSVNRQIEMTSESSYELIIKVAKAFKENGGIILLNTRVEKLILNNKKKLSSLIAESKYKTTKVNFKSLILAAGGWGARAYKTKKTDIPYYGPMTSTGDYFDFAKNMNLAVRNLNWYKIYPHGLEVAHGIAKLTTYATKKVSDMGAIFVNKDGKRIVNESAPYTYFRNAIANQNSRIAYIIMDQKMWDMFYKLLLRYNFTKSEIKSFFNLNGEKSPVLVKGSLRKVSEKAGINYETLAKTLDNYTKYVNSAYDPEFYRDAKYLHNYEGKTYYVIEQKLRFCTTLGGYETNANMQLLDKNINPIDNFFAAGEVVGGANGNDSMPSMMNSWSYASGFVAGTNAADNVNFNI